MERSCKPQPPTRVRGSDGSSHRAFACNPPSAELSRRSQRRPRPDSDASTAGPAGTAASEGWPLQDSNGRRTETSHARCAGNRAPPLPLRRPYLASAGLQHSSRSYVEDTLPVWGQVLPQEPGALAPTTCARPSRLVLLVFDWSSSLASPRVAGASREVLASAQSMRADRRAASRDGLDEEEGRWQEAVAGTPK